MNPQEESSTPSAKRAKRIGRMENRLREWGVRLGELRVRVEKAGPLTQADYGKRVDDLNDKLAVATARLQALRVAVEGDMAMVESGLDHAWTDLEVAFKRLKE